MTFQGHQKIHIISVGFEVDRAVLPIERIGGDKVYIIRDEKDKQTSKKIYRKYIDEVKNQLKKIINEEKIIEIECDIHNISNLISKIAGLIKKEKGLKNDVLINVSCGTKLYSAASIIAGLMFKASPYYAEVEKYITDEKEERFFRNGRPMGISEGIKDLIEIPEFKLTPPKEELIQVLSIINKAPEPKTQSSIIIRLERKGLMQDILDEQRKKVSRKALQKFRRDYLEPLLNNKWLEKEGQRRSAKLKITDDGRKILEIFENVYLN